MYFFPLHLTSLHVFLQWQLTKAFFSADSPNNNVLIFSQLLIIIFSHETQWDRLEPFRGVEFIAFGGVECIALTQRIHADKSRIQYYSVKHTKKKIWGRKSPCYDWTSWRKSLIL